MNARDAGCGAAFSAPRELSRRSLRRKALAGHCYEESTRPTCSSSWRVHEDPLPKFVGRFQGRIMKHPPLVAAKLSASTRTARVIEAGERGTAATWDLSLQSTSTPALPSSSLKAFRARGRTPRVVDREEFTRRAL